MPNPLAEAYAAIGYAAGFLTGSAFGWLLAKHKPRDRYLRGRSVPAPEWPFKDGKMVVFERDVLPTLPVGMRIYPPPPWTPGRDTMRQLAEIVRRASYSSVPAAGVRLSWRACRDAGMTRQTWERLTAHILEPPAVGYRRDGSVWLARDRCAALLAWRGRTCDE